MNHHRRCIRLNLRALAGLLAAAVASVSMTGCESPFAADSTPYGDGESQSIIARALARDGYAGDMQTATVNGGVRELARVDDAGPGTSTAPTTNPTVTSISMMGLPQAALNMDEPVVRLTLQDVIYRTVNHSLAIKVEGYNPGIQESTLLQAEAAFDPIVFGQSTWSTTNAPTSPSPTTTNGQSWLNELGVKKNLTTGGTISAFTSVAYQDLALPPNTFDRINYTSALNITIDQPLLRGFGSDYAEASIYLAQRDLRTSLSDFKKQVIQSVGDAEEAYQSLVLSRTIVEINIRLVLASQQTYDRVLQRQNLDATKESVGQAHEALLERRASLIAAQENYRIASDKLKALMNDPKVPNSSNILIDPIDRPIAEPVNYSIAESIALALEQRPEMQDARLALEKADIVVKVSKNGLLPELDLVAGMQTNAVNNSLERSFSQTISPANFIDWNAGVQLQFPLGNRLAEANLRENQLKRTQAVTNMMAVAETVVDDVREQLADVMIGYLSIQTLDEARQAAADAIQGNLDIESIRPLSPEALQLKLSEQATLANDEINLAQEIVKYNIAIERVERAKGTLLEFDHISLNHAPINPPLNGIDKFFFTDTKIPALLK